MKKITENQNWVLAKKRYEKGLLPDPSTLSQYATSERSSQLGQV